MTILADTESGTVTITEQQDRTLLSDFYRVLVHNDDHTHMDRVVEVLMKVFGLEEQPAACIMLEAHRNGAALCCVEPLEQAELHRDQLRSAGLLSTIEKNA